MILLLKLFKIKKILQDVQGIKPGTKDNSKFRLSFHYPQQKFATVCCSHALIYRKIIKKNTS